VIAVRDAVAAAVERARGGGGPGLVEALTYRLGDHSTADDASRYRPEQELSAQWLLEPLSRLRAFLARQGFWTKEQEETLIRGSAAEVEAARQAFLAIKPAPVGAIFDYQYATLPASLRAQRAQAVGTDDA